MTRLEEEINKNINDAYLGYGDFHQNLAKEYLLKTVKDFAVSFSTFFAENCYELFDSKTYYIRDHHHYDDAYNIEDIFHLWHNELL